MIQRLPTLIAAVALLWCDSAAAGPLPPAEEARVLAALRAKVRKAWKKYKGVSARRKVVIQELDPKDGRLKKKREVGQRFVLRFGSRPTVKITSCKIDGKPASHSECKPKRKRPPPYPVFGPRAGTHYRLRISGTARIKGKPCHVLSVLPKKRTARHLRGRAYVTKQGLRLVKVEGRPASFPFGLKAFYIQIYFWERDGVPLESWGRIDMRVRVPLIVDLRLVTIFRARSHKLLR